MTPERFQEILQFRRELAYQPAYNGANMNDNLDQLKKIDQLIWQYLKN